MEQRRFGTWEMSGSMYEIDTAAASRAVAAAIDHGITWFPAGRR